MNRAPGTGTGAGPGALRAAVSVIALAAALLLTSCGAQDTAAPPAGSGGQGAAQGSAGGQEPAAGDDAGQGGAALPRSAPRVVSIPSLGVQSELETLGQNKDGTMTTPKNPDLAGWYEPGPTPGSQGPAVIAGHVTWNGKAAVFEKLKTLKAGDTIKVTREDGKTAEFAVDRIAEYPKKEFPTLEVYKNLDHAGLRLVTCGGEFDADRHYYPNNVVVFAKMVGAA
ncbi:class F sortase [Streptomyces wuyuanensis]|uniref:LPXTG-site transpeptidase (Sortase) family protein n=1 Tax=Streptomyces wuyuanensis TaxID=1196353 RepID=A0A1G9XCH9_9ACTN|nr:class F sortase [Streptomyces wuyuanensis]SDM94156.1 LPXTG-site transpeptidase (sortase) family protein [Streptomyces wuyuanensis]